MKTILLLLILFTATASNAQIINFPDANFKSGLLFYHPGLDANSDGEIDATEALTLRNIYVEFSDITDLTGIEYFTNVTNLDIAGNQLTSFTTIPSFIILDTLNCSGNLLTSLDVSSLVNLTYLDCGNNQLSTLNINGLSQLLYFWCTGNQLTSLEVTGSPNLISLCLDNNNISALDLTGLNNLEALVCQFNNLSVLDLTGLTNLRFFQCSNNHLSSLNLDGFVHLNYLECTQNQLSFLHVANCTSLQTLSCYLNQLTSLDLSQGLDSLYSLYCNYNMLTSLDVSNCPLITTLSCGDNQLVNLNLNNSARLFDLGCFRNLLTSLDISGSPLLSNLNAQNNNLLSVNLKNGPVVISNLNLQSNPNLQYVCADDAEIISLSNYFTQNGMTGVNVNSYCSFTPGGQYFTATGTLRMDIDNNGCTISDPAINLSKIKIDDGTQYGYTTTNATGVYNFYTGSGNFTITPQFQNPYFNVNPSSVSIPLNNASPTQVADFCVSPNGVHADLEITLVPVGAARPGFHAAYQLVYKNKGNQTLSGDVQLNFDDTRLDLFSANPVFSTQSSGYLSWIYANLLPFESRSIYLDFNVLPPPVNNIHDTLLFTAVVDPVGGDETVPDNNTYLQQLVVSSFDPNDKTCLEGKFIDITNIGEYVHYVIHFQNMGNDTAFNIVVADLLSEKYDWNSLEVIKTSHPCVTRQTQGNKIEFIFQNIKLPPQLVNDAGSNGFVAFKIKPANTVNFQDSLINNASIFFDFNFPVITNDAVSIFDSLNILPVSFEYFKGQKQETKNILTWKINCNCLTAIFEIERSSDNKNFTSIGNITASGSRNLLPFDFTDNNPLTTINYYRIKMADENGKMTYSNMIALLNKKAGFDIVSLAPNPVNKVAVLNITSAQSQQINIMVTDAVGRNICAISQITSAGSSQIQMDLGKLSKGIYFIIIKTSEGEKKKIRFVKE